MNTSKKIIVKLVEVTPEMAAAMLEKNTMNRNISMLTVRRYAQAMASDEWEMNGETIIVAEDETILDGQHRLWAVIESGKTVRFLIVYNVKKTSITTVDSGIARTFRHVLQIKGSKHATTAASLTKLAWIYDNYDRELKDGSAKVALRNTVLETYYDENRDRIEQAAAAADVGAHHFVKSHMAFCYYLFLRSNPVKADEFIKLVKTGETLTTKHPVMSLRLRLFDNITRKTKLSVRETAALYIKAWNAFIKGNDLSVFRWNSTEPLPEVK